MDVVLRYFDGCPHWRLALDRILEATGPDRGVVTLERVDDPDHAAALAFTGSPTILVDGIDPFADPGQPVGFSCRVYDTPDGPQGAPSVEQLRAVLAH